MTSHPRRPLHASTQPLIAGLVSELRDIMSTELHPDPSASSPPPTQDGEPSNTSSSTSSTSSTSPSAQLEGNQADAEWVHLQLDDALTFEELLARAKAFEDSGRFKVAATYYLFCLDRFKDSTQGDLIASALGSLARLCVRREQYEQALRFRMAEKMVYETYLLAYAQLEHATELASQVPLYDEDEVGDEAPEAVVKLGEILDPARIRDILTQERQAPSEEQALAWERVGEMCFKEGNLEMAKRYALKAIDIRERLQEQVEREDDALKFARLGREEYLKTLRSIQGDDADDADEEDDDEDDERKQVQPAPAEEPPVAAAPAPVPPAKRMSPVLMLSLLVLLVAVCVGLALRYYDTLLPLLGLGKTVKRYVPAQRGARRRRPGHARDL